MTIERLLTIDAEIKRLTTEKAEVTAELLADNTIDWPVRVDGATVAKVKATDQTITRTFVPMVSLVEAANRNDIDTGKGSDFRAVIGNPLFEIQKTTLDNASGDEKTNRKAWTALHALGNNGWTSAVNGMADSETKPSKRRESLRIARK